MIGNCIEKLKITYEESEISTECTFGSATYCTKEQYTERGNNLIGKDTRKWKIY